MTSDAGSDLVRKGKGQRGKKKKQRQQQHTTSVHHRILFIRFRSSLSFWLACFSYIVFLGSLMPRHHTSYAFPPFLASLRGLVFKYKYIISLGSNTLLLSFLFEHTTHFVFLKLVFPSFLFWGRGLVHQVNFFGFITTHFGLVKSYTCTLVLSSWFAFVSPEYTHTCFFFHTHTHDLFARPIVFFSQGTNLRNATVVFPPSVRGAYKYKYKHSFQIQIYLSISNKAARSRRSFLLRFHHNPKSSNPPLPPPNQHLHLPLFYHSHPRPSFHLQSFSRNATAGRTRRRKAFPLNAAAPPRHNLHSPPTSLSPVHTHPPPRPKPRRQQTARHRPLPPPLPPFHLPS
jgi:hypothetical protein